jgi:putative tryptophan/tyrosine transport system substrate-binding protein
MRRREFVTSILTFASMLPNATEGAPLARTVTIGVIAPPSFSAVDGLRTGFRDLGYVEGQNLRLEYRWTEGPADHYFIIASELVRAGVDAIVTYGTPAAIGARRATTTLPIIMAAVGDPVATQIVSSLARPGGNVTGFSSLTTELEVKRLEILKELLPKLQRLGLLLNLTNPAVEFAARAVQQEAQSRGLTIDLAAVRGSEFDSALFLLRKVRPDAILVLADPILLSRARDIVAFMSEQQLIAIYSHREFVQIGGLLSYGTNYHELFRKTAGYVDRILKGTKPSDLPVQQADRFELVLNLNAARELSLDISPTLLALADEVIE